MVANKRTYLSDHVNQTRVAQVRNRPIQNRGVGLRMDHSPVDFATLGRRSGWKPTGPSRRQASYGTNGSDPVRPWL